LGSIQKHLIGQSKTIPRYRFPSNNEVINSLKEKDIYSIDTRNKMYLFERLENFENKEPVEIYGNENITIEHIFPQNPDKKWKEELGIDECKHIQEKYLHTIGNLTLLGNNAKLGNKSFIEKRDLKDVGYKASRLWLNKSLASLNCWNEKAIEKRFKMIADRFLEIWQYPDIKIETISDNEEINIFDADDPTFQRIEYIIFRDEKIIKNSFSEYYVEIFKKLFELQPETFFTTDLGNRIKFSKIGEESTSLRTLPINDTYSVGVNYSAKGFFDRIKDALTKFDLKDELLIKYSAD
jgi:hypothetical protein